MISTRVMDIKLREAAEGLGEDSTGKKKSKFKTFKKFFGKKKRKESPSSTGNSTWKQSQAKSEVIAIESGPVGYDSEDELEESRGALGSRALSHDSIFIPESGQDPTRPVRVFSQENVCDRIKALQLKIQCNVKMGPPPPPGGLPAKRGDDTGMSSEDDGLPRSPPEMSLHDIGPGTTIKVSLVSSSRPQSPDQLSSRHASDASVSPRTSDSSVAPVADFDYPPEFSSCLDNSAAKHKLLVKPRNQRSSKMRRLSSRAQSESLSDLTCTPEEEEYDDKSLPKVSTEENPNSAQQDVGLDRSPEPGGLATMLQSGGPRARRARLQHCPALSASAEEESFLGDNTSSRPATPEVIESESGPVPRAESPSLPEGSPHHHHNPDSEIQREEPSLESTSPPARETVDEVICASGDIEIRLSPSIPEGDTTPPETDPGITSETPPGLDGPDQSVQKEVELTLEAPEPEGAGKGSPEAPAPSPSAPKSCLKHKAPAVSESPGAPAACEPPAEEPAPGPLDGEAEPPRAEPAEPPQGGPERPAPERKVERAGSELRAVKFSVSSGRAWPRSGSARLLEHAGPAGALPVRLPLLRSSLAWRSEAALDDLRAPPEPHGGGGSRDSGDAAAGPGRSPRDAPGDPCPAAREPTSGEDRGPFAVKLRSTSLSFKHREASSAEARGIKRYSAEIRLERGGLALLPKDEKCQVAKAPSPRGARSPHEQGKGKARPSEPLSSKPPLPRKPQLQSRPLPSPDAGPGELVKAALPQDLRRETRSAETRSQHRAAEKGPPPAAEGQPAPPWITIARQKRRGTPNQPPNQEDKPGVRTLKSEIGKQAKAPERAQEPMKQADFVRSKSFLIAPAKPTVDRRQGTKLRLQEGLQRGISLSHQNLAAQSAVMTEKELHQLKRASYASADQPSWMELARKKSQAWSDMPQIIK
ncbi:CRACD-like protein isoform X1 [Neofelis nebulosa]|uniref:CRACD-like protein isoform X1 n=2 Tax=Neofelis nebulosa TaxID=61452 RepID=UPI00272B21CB|nr:CRACD-like protein isoform X1 [Neofelis nebulosa]XP_058540359.1 CRACD-like protein isoform X1 [Neofelis nebulosa]XP_058540360.1 CRACD-like protein isoform X1 [Neofelis nebulosa]